MARRCDEVWLKLCCGSSASWTVSVDARSCERGVGIELYSNMLNTRVVE
jgi:hypothetical protein